MIAFERIEMTKAVWKYEIEARDRQSIHMPVNAEILCVQMQNGNPCIWALGDPEDARQEREFLMLGTGHNAAPESIGRYIGTFQMSGGSLVFHLFEGGV